MGIEGRLHGWWLIVGAGEDAFFLGFGEVQGFGVGRKAIEADAVGLAGGKSERGAGGVVALADAAVAEHADAHKT